DGERQARAVGRGASAFGAVGGLILTSQILTSAGAVSGLSAAGITSGLAAVGGLAGGGMAVGAAVLSAVPALLAALVGYAAYRAVRHIGNRDSIALRMAPFAT